MSKIRTLFSCYRSLKKKTLFRYYLKEVHKWFHKFTESGIYITWHINGKIFLFFVKKIKETLPKEALCHIIFLKSNSLRGFYKNISYKYVGCVCFSTETRTNLREEHINKF